MKYRILNHHLFPITSANLSDIYELTNNGNEYIYGCVPNGELGITVILSGESYIQIGDNWVQQPNISVYGLIKQRQFIRISKNYREITIGFKPYIFQLFIKDSMCSLLKNQCTDLVYLFDKYEVEKFYSQINESKNDFEILKGIEIFLLNNFNKKKADLRIVVANDLIFNKNIWNVDELSKNLEISSTWLRNIFNEKMGLSPKEMIKIARIKITLENKFEDEESLTNLAVKLDYFDQSHFIHDFKNAIGMTPKKYFSNKKLTFDFYNFARWRIDSFEENIFSNIE